MKNHLTVSEAMKYCNVAKSTIYEWIKKDVIIAKKLGGKTLILKSSIEPKPFKTK